MPSPPLPDDLRSALERLGATDLVVGLATRGPSATAAVVAAAVRAGLETHFAGQSAVVLHVQHAPSEETMGAPRG